MKAKAITIKARRHGAPFTQRQPKIVDGRDLSAAFYRDKLRGSLERLEDALAWFAWSGASTKGPGYFARVHLPALRQGARETPIATA